MKKNLRLLLVLFLLACGRKGPPLPPLREVPETTTDLQVHQEENTLVLTWSYPALTRSGRQLFDLGSIEVWRVLVPPGQEKALEGPQGVELKRQLVLAQGKPWARLEGEQLKAATVGALLEFRDPLPLPEQAPSTYLYAVRSRRRDGTPSDFSNVVSWRPQPPPPPVQGLTAQPKAEGVELTWTPLPQATYRVERQEGGSWKLLTPELSAARFLDSRAPQGQTHTFQVRAVVAGVWGPAASVSVDFPDLYPPPSPTGLVCLPEAERVWLRWEPVPEAGVGYRVYRRGRGGEWVQLSDLLDRPEFADLHPPQGELIYGVGAVDAAGNESAPATCGARSGP